MADQGNEILDELKKISRMLALVVTKDLSQKDKVVLLSGLSLQPREIADLIGTTPNTVSVTLSNLRRAGKNSRENKS